MRWRSAVVVPALALACGHVIDLHAIPNDGGTGAAEAGGTTSSSGSSGTPDSGPPAPIGGRGTFCFDWFPPDLCFDFDQNLVNGGLQVDRPAAFKEVPSPVSEGNLLQVHHSVGEQPASASAVLTTHGNTLVVQADVSFPAVTGGPPATVEVLGFTFTGPSCGVTAMVAAREAADGVYLEVTQRVLGDGGAGPTVLFEVGPVARVNDGAFTRTWLTIRRPSTGDAAVDFKAGPPVPDGGVDERSRSVAVPIPTGCDRTFVVGVPFITGAVSEFAMDVDNIVVRDLSE